MKKLVFAAVSLTISVACLFVNQAHAATVDSCEPAKDLAYYVMLLRQDDTPREIVESHVSSDLGISLIEEAYSSAQVYKRDIKKSAVDYSKRIYKECKEKELLAKSI